MFDFNASQASHIEANDIVVQVAKMIDPAAFSEWYDSTDNNDPVQPDIRKKYMQAKALSLANDILKLAARQPDLSSQLAISEMDNWERLGMPISENQELREIIAEKYPQS